MLLLWTFSWTSASWLFRYPCAHETEVEPWCPVPNAIQMYCKRFQTCQSQANFTGSCRASRATHMLSCSKFFSRLVHVRNLLHKYVLNITTDCSAPMSQVSTPSVSDQALSAITPKVGPHAELMVCRQAGLDAAGWRILLLAGVQPGDLEAAGGRLWTSTMLSCLMALRRVKGMTVNGYHAYYPC